MRSKSRRTNKKHFIKERTGPWQKRGDPLYGERTRVQTAKITIDYIYTDIQCSWLFNHFCVFG